jgi:chromosome segregation protein
MRLKRLELYGYKSFASRVGFDFPEGLTAIIGPNGSGKSNIADAIRWVTGEQNSRTLRATTSSDMIFAGSRNRARLGMCEVLVTLDNADGSLPVAFSEVTIGRRAFRSGDNEYLLNGNRVRYRDIVDLLGAAGLARSTYTVIGQGVVDAALALRPQARRALFEEAAGIGPHLRKRDEALARIAETERNLERVSDILNEIKPRARSLRRQAERAEEYLLLRQDLQELQRIWYGYQWQRCRHDLARAERQLAQQMAQVEAQRRYSASFTEKQETAAAQLAALRQRVDGLRQAERDIRLGAENVRRGLAVAVERDRLYQQQDQALAGEIEALASRRVVLTAEIETVSQELARQQEAQTTSQADLEGLRQQVSTLNAARAERESGLQQHADQLDRVLASLAQQRARHEQATEEQRRLASEQAQAERQITLISPRIAEIAQRGQKAAQELGAAEQRLAELEKHGLGFEQQLAEARRAIETTDKELRRARAALDRLASRQDLLARLRADLTGYHPGVRAALSARGEIGGLLGTVAELMRVPDEYEEAIESALGARLQNIVAERWEDAEKAIALLKETQGGWATFLPLDTLRPRSPMRVQRSDEVLGIASELVRFEDRLRPVFELLLGRIVIVRDLPAARHLLRERTGAALIVTLEGETVQPSGAVSGGSRRQNSNLLAQEREYRQLPAQVEQAEALVEQALAAHGAAEEQLDAVRRDQTATEADTRRSRAALQQAQEALARLARDQRELERESQWQQTQRENAGERLAQASQQAQDSASKIATAEQRQVELSRQIADQKDELAASRNETLQQQLAQVETRVAVAQRTADSQRRLIASHQQNLAQLVGEIDAKQRRRSDLAGELLELAARQQADRQELQSLDQRAAQAEEQIGPATEQIKELEATRQAIAAQYNESLERLHATEVEHNEAVLQRDRLRDRQTALAREIEGEIGPIDLPETVSHQLRLNLSDDVLELPEVGRLPVGLEEEIRQLRNRLKRIGAINPEAPQEYNALLERQTFLDTQAGDLRGAIAGLHEVIAELDEIIDRDFAATITAVNAAFGDYFRVLFGGGTAHLELTEPDSMSTTGVEIVAHPPGKRSQGLSLLSGGERSLTAVALLFALLVANPVPFCFLDEVDAALDEANVSRFRDLLVERAAVTQFVVITHNRRTIDAANTIYGISMSEQGVSQHVSLRLDQQDQPVTAA